MPANDTALQTAFTSLAATSAGAVQFRAITTRELGAELHLELGRSPNPVYDFKVALPGEEAFRTVAYTLALDGSRRPATRAEALGRGLAANNGALFKANPFLLVFDYAENRLMAVSAADLFGAFADEVAARPIPSTDSASFSLSPSFQNATVSMYATVTGSAIWSSLVADITVEGLKSALTKMRDRTAARAEDIPRIVDAIKDRLEGAATTPLLGGASSTREDVTVSTIAIPTVEGLGQENVDVKVPPRLWRMIVSAIKSSPAVLLVGPPGTGKTELVRKAVKALTPRDPLWATPEESWTARDLIGGETIVDGELAFRPGWVLRAIEANRWLVLDEANRADMDKIFGGLLTWLSGGSVSVGVESTAPGARTIELGWARSGEAAVASANAADSSNPVQYLAQNDWRIVGTYNALDAQRVFRFGAALGRRFARIPVPAIDPVSFAEALSDQAGDLEEGVREAVRRLYEAHFERSSTRFGPAVFLAMCRYLRAAKSTPLTTDAATIASNSGDSSQEAAEAAAGIRVETLMAEAYVVSVGSMLAHVEDDDYAELKTRVLSKGIFTEEDWSWISEMIAALA